MDKENKTTEEHLKIEDKSKDEQIKELMEGLNKATKDIELLKKVADKKQLSLYYQRHKEDLPTIVKLREIDGKVVIGWKSLKNEVYEIAPGKWVEDQQTQVLYEDGTTEEMTLKAFYRRYVSVPCNRKSIVTDEITGETAFKLARQDNGKEYTIGVQFVN